MWSLDKDKVMYMSKVLKLKIYDKDVWPIFLLERVIWFDLQLAKLGGIHLVQ